MIRVEVSTVVPEVASIEGNPVLQSERQTMRLKPMQVDKDDRSSSSSKKVINKYFTFLNMYMFSKQEEYKCI